MRLPLGTPGRDLKAVNLRPSDVVLAAAATIEVDSGPEFIMGSTRMKAGTAQKLVMNMISTTVMIQLGHTYDNLMIKLRCGNQKGKNRKIRLFCEAVGRQDRQYAQRALDEADGDVCVAALRELTGAETGEVIESLRSHGDNFHDTLRELTYRGAAFLQNP